MKRGNLEWGKSEEGKTRDGKVRRGERKFEEGKESLRRGNNTREKYEEG